MQIPVQILACHLRGPWRLSLWRDGCSNIDWNAVMKVCVFCLLWDHGHHIWGAGTTVRPWETGSLSRMRAEKQKEVGPLIKHRMADLHYKAQCLALNRPILVEFIDEWIILILYSSRWGRRGVQPRHFLAQAWSLKLEMEIWNCVKIDWKIELILHFLFSGFASFTFIGQFSVDKTGKYIIIVLLQ